MDFIIVYPRYITRRQSLYCSSIGRDTRDTKGRDNVDRTGARTCCRFYHDFPKVTARGQDGHGTVGGGAVTEALCPAPVVIPAHATLLELALVGAAWTLWDKQKKLSKKML